MIKALLCPCLVLATSLGGPGAFPVQPTRPLEALQVKVERIPQAQPLKPLLDLIARGEGTYDSVNRGWADDTPGGMLGLTGRRLTSYTVGEVLQMQRGWLYAVGRYQFIPSTLRDAVAWAGVDYSDKFSEEVQDRLAIALLKDKRPAVWEYLTTGYGDLRLAMDELAREWASLEYRYGRGYYDRVGGNRAHVSRAELSAVLQNIKQNWPD